MVLTIKPIRVPGGGGRKKRDSKIHDAGMDAEPCATNGVSFSSRRINLELVNKTKESEVGAIPRKASQR